MTPPADTTPSAAPGDLRELAKIGQRYAESWTMRPADALWVAEQALARPDLDGLAIHRELRQRIQYYPSAREVSAVCSAVRAARSPTDLTDTA